VGEEKRNTNFKTPSPTQPHFGGIDYYFIDMKMGSAKQTIGFSKNIDAFSRKQKKN